MTLSVLEEKDAEKKRISLRQKCWQTEWDNCSKGSSFHTVTYAFKIYIYVSKDWEIRMASVW